MRRLKLQRAEFLALARDLLGHGHGFRFTAHGSSMHPSIRDGDAITVRAVPAGGPLPGAIVLYLRPDHRPVVHRVVARHVSGLSVLLEIRGDASTGPAERVGREEVLGEIVSVERQRRALALCRRLLRLVERRLLDAPDRS